MARCTLNNMIMRNVRKTHAYQTVIVDLVLLDVIEKDTAEKLLGYTIPSYIELPADVVYLNVDTQKRMRRNSI